MWIASDWLIICHEETQPAEGGAGRPGDGAGAAGFPGLPGDSDLDRPEPARGRQHHPAAADARYVMCHMSCVGMSCVSVCHIARYVTSLGMWFISAELQGRTQELLKGRAEIVSFIASHVVFLSAPLLKIDAFSRI